MTRNQKVFLVVILAVGFLLHLLAINYALPIRFFSDEFIHLANSLKMLDQKTLFLDFSYLPPLFAYLLMPFILLYGVFGIALGTFAGLSGFKEYVILNSENLLVFSRFIAAVFGTLSIYFVFKWAKELFNLRVAFFSTIILTILPLHLVESQAGRFWLPLSFFIFLAAYFLYRLAQSGMFKWYQWSVLMIGLGFGMGLISIVMIPWFFLAHYLVVKKYQRKFFNKDLIINLLWLICLIGFFVLANTYTIFRQFGRGIGTIADIFGASLQVPQAPAVHLDNNFIDVLVSISKVLWSNFYLQLVLIITGLIILIKKKEFWRNLSNYFLVVFPIVYLSGLTIVFSEVLDRYLMPALFFLSMVAAYGLDWLLKTIHQKKLLTILLLTVFFFLPFYFTYSYSEKLLHKNTYLQAKSWIEENIPTGSRLVIDNAQYLYLTSNKISLDLQKENNPVFYDTRDQLLTKLELDKYPQPHYFLYYLDHLDLTMLKPEDFSVEYLVVGFWNKSEDWSPQKQSLFSKYKIELIEEFYPTKEKYYRWPIAAAHNTTVNSLSTLNRIERLGPRIEIYQLILRD